MDQPSSADDSGITLRIKFKSESVDNFIARYGADVSPGGIFIRTKDPLGVGTNLRFEFSLADGQPLLLGHGTVVWVREPDQARAGVVPGMGVRFDKLTGHSQNVLGTILAGKAKRDGSGAARVAAPGRVSQMAAAIPNSERPAAAADRPKPSVPVATLARHATPADGNSSDPWQSDKTEIARMPPTFAFDPPAVKSEELSLSGAIADTDPPPAMPPPAPVVAAPPAPRKPAEPERPVRAPTPALGVQPDALRRPSGNVAPIQAPGMAGLRTSPGIGPATGGPVAPSALRPSSPGMALPSHDADTTDKFNREHQSVTGPLPTPGRGKMLIVVGLAAAATCAVGFLVLQKRLTQKGPPAASTVATAEPAPSAPPAAQEPPSAAAPTPPPAAPPPAAPVAAAPAATPPPAEAPTPARPAAAPAETKPAPVATIEPTARPSRSKPARPARRPARAAAAATAPEPPAEGAEPPPAEEGTAAAPTDEYWLKVNSNPSGAEVLIDGQVEGKTPFERRLFDTSRPYALTVRKAGFESHEQMLSASDDWVKRGKRRTLSVSAKLPRAKGLPPASELEPTAKPAEEKAAPEKAPEPAPATEPPPPAQP